MFTLPEFYLVLPSFTEFYRVLPSFTEFYPGFIEFTVLSWFLSVVAWVTSDSMDGVGILGRASSRAWLDSLCPANDIGHTAKRS